MDFCKYSVKLYVRSGSEDTRNSVVSSRGVNTTIRTSNSSRINVILVVLITSPAMVLLQKTR